MRLERFEAGTFRGSARTPSTPLHILSCSGSFDASEEQDAVRGGLGTFRDGELEEGLRAAVAT